MDTFEFFENFVQEDKKSATNILGFIEFCPHSNLKNLCAVFKHFSTGVECSELIKTE
jgi:hypothetical protein